MQLTPDYSFLIQVVTFIVLWTCLKRWLFDPTLHVLDTRRQRTEGAKVEAGQFAATTTAAKDEYDQRVREVRAQIQKESDAARKAAQDEYSQALAKVRTAATEEQARLRAGLTTQIEAARQTLAGEAHTIAFEMLDQVTGRPSA